MVEVSGAYEHDKYEQIWSKSLHDFRVLKFLPHMVADQLAGWLPVWLAGWTKLIT